MYDDTQNDMIKIENTIMKYNSKVKCEVLLFDNHNLHIQMHTELLKTIDPNRETILDKILYSLKLKERTNPITIENHIQEHIDQLNTINKNFYKL